VTHLPQTPVKFDPPKDNWQPCAPHIDGSPRTCRSCNRPNIVWREHESSCGGWEDTEFKCTDCGYTWWVDGTDS